LAYSPHMACGMCFGKDFGCFAGFIHGWMLFFMIRDGWKMAEG